MKLNIILFSFFILFFLNSTEAQKNKDVIADFNNSEFMTEIRMMRTTAIETVRLFQNNISGNSKKQYTNEEIASIRQAYGRLAIQHNHLLKQIGEDLQDKYMIRMMKKYPGRYESTLNGYAHDLKKVYETDFLQTVNDIEKGFGGPIIIISLLEFTGQLISNLARFNIQKRAVKAEVVQSQIIQPNIFPQWERISANANDSYGNDSYNGMDNFNDEYDSEFPNDF